MSILERALVSVLLQGGLVAGQAAWTQSPARFDPYGKWLNEDVAYIITKEESAAFQRLEDDREREKFIEQFWLRRDPTPGTEENEFKREHYRRIAYANERFAAAIPGWKTDRGRTYILYGPPDEIESHPGGSTYQWPAEDGGVNTTTAPFELWYYRYLEGLGYNLTFGFTDANMTDEYRLTLSPGIGSSPAGGQAPNAFVHSAGKPGPHVLVEVLPGRTVSISVPLDSFTGRATVTGRITDPLGRAVAVFEDGNLQGQAWQKSVNLSSGSYTLDLVLTDAAGGRESEVAFVVK